MKAIPIAEFTPILTMSHSPRKSSSITPNTSMIIPTKYRERSLSMSWMVLSTLSSMASGTRDLTIRRKRVSSFMKKKEMKRVAKAPMNRFTSTDAKEPIIPPIDDMLKTDDNLSISISVASKSAPTQGNTLIIHSLTFSRMVR